MKKRLLYLILPVITLILEISPYGAVCNFSDGPTSVIRKTFSYFSLIPFGYASFAPLITAILTCIILLLLVIHFFSGKEILATKAKNMCCICAVFSFGPLVFGIRYFSVVGLLISLSILAELLLLHIAVRRSNTTESQ